MLARFSREMPRAGVGHFHFHRAVVGRAAHFQHPAGGHGVARIQEQIQEHLLQPVARSQHRRQFRIQVPNHLHLAGAERMRQQRERFLHHLVQAHRLKFRRAGARKIQQVIHDFARPERLLDDLVDQRLPRIARRQLLGQHLDVVRDHRQRRIHFVRHARRQQAQRGQLLGLQELVLQVRALRDVVQQDQPPDALAFLAHQRRHRDVHHQVPLRARAQRQLVQAGDVIGLRPRRQFRHQARRQHLVQPPVDGLLRAARRSAARVCVFQDSTRPFRSTASTPTLSDSTMFSEKSFSRSICSALFSSDEYSRALSSAMAT